LKKKERKVFTFLLEKSIQNTVQQTQFKSW